MIFDLTKHFVPEVYSESRDYRVFLKLLGVLITVNKYNIDRIPDLYDPMEVPDNLLESLASLVGYDYDESLKLSYNRVITKYFPYLIRNRGSERGIELAIALSLNTSEFENISSMEDIIVNFDYETATIKVFYPRDTVIKKNLIEVVRPVGMVVEAEMAEHGKSTNELELIAKVNYIKDHHTDDMSKVDTSQVEFDEEI